jgi:hypothetical protein
MNTEILFSEENNNINLASTYNLHHMQVLLWEVAGKPWWLI